MNYKARERQSYWTVEQAIPCINGLTAWFTISRVDDPDEQEIGYSDGRIGSAELRANLIADTLNK